MKPLMNRRFVVAVLTITCLMTVLLTVTPIRSGIPGPGEYDAWLDWNDDGKIDMMDVSRVARAFGTNGLNVSKASLVYDSGWLDFRNYAGDNFTINHSLGDSELNIDVREISRGLNKTFGGADADEAFDLVQTSDGGYALTGRTNSSGAYDFCLVKFDFRGSLQWSNTYGSWWGDGALAVVQTEEGGYALAGYEYSHASGTDYWLVKTDDSGVMLWNRTYVEPATDYCYDLAQTVDGGYALVGWSGSFYPWAYDFWLVKTDSDGNMQWNQHYGGTEWDYAYAMVQTNDGGYALAGETNSFGSGGFDFWLVKTDALGTMAWNRTFGGVNDDSAYAIVQTADGGYALAGTTASFGAGRNDFWLVKTDPDGNMEWNKTYGGVGDESVYVWYKRLAQGMRWQVQQHPLGLATLTSGLLGLILMAR